MTPFAAYGSYAGQEGRDYAAGYIRSYAQHFGYSLIDVGRTFGMIRDGRDVCDTYFEERLTETFEPAIGYRAVPGDACRDFTARFTVPAEAWDSGAHQPFCVTLSSESSNVVMIDNAAGKLRFKVYRGSSILMSTDVSSIDTPTGDRLCEVTVKGSMFTFRLLSNQTAGPTISAPFSKRVVRFGGLFRPRFRYYNSADDGPIKNMKLGVGREKLYVPAISDLDFWGIPSASSGTTRPVTGGNGINHPSSRGTAAVYGLHFASQHYPIPYRSPYAVGDIIMMQVDGTDSIGAYGTVTGTRLTPARVSGGYGSSPGQLIGTVWECLGLVSGAAPADRTTLWRRIR